MKQSKMSDDLSFVIRQYSQDAFNRSRAWKSLALIYVPWWRRHIVAAACSATVLAAAAAATMYYVSHEERTDTGSSESSPVIEQYSDTIHRFEFNDIRISEAARQIEHAYGLKLEGIPASDPSITLTFEGNPEELVSLINESLDSKITIRK